MRRQSVICTLRLIPSWLQTRGMARRCGISVAGNRRCSGLLKLGKFVLPAWYGAWQRQCLGRKNAACDGAGHYISGDRAQFGKAAGFVRQWPPPRRSGEKDVAVERAVHGIDRATGRTAPLPPGAWLG